MKYIQIIEKDPLIRKLLELFLEQLPDFQQGEPADVILLDAKELDRFTDLRKTNPTAKIAVMTNAPDYDYLHISRALRADGFWYQIADAEELNLFLQKVLSDSRPFPEQAPVVKLANTWSNALTRRELEVLRETTAGKTDAQIGETLGMSVPTVKHHIQQLLLKTGLENRTQLATAAVSSRLIVLKCNKM